MKKIIICIIIFIAAFLTSSFFIYKNNSKIIIKELSFEKHWFVLYIQDKNTNIIFDTGNCRKNFLKSLKKNNVDIKQAKYILISHKDYDHSNGLLDLKKGDLSPKTKVVINNDVLKGITESYGKDTIKNINIINPVDNFYINRNIIYTKTLLGIAETHGKQWGIQESFLIIKKHNKLTIISGCAHPGIIEMVEYAKKITGCDKINAVVGGLGVIGEKEARYLNDTKADIYPIHCTEYKEGSLLKVKKMPLVIK